MFLLNEINRPMQALHSKLWLQKLQLPPITAQDRSVVPCPSPSPKNATGSFVLEAKLSKSPAKYPNGIVKDG